jgi:type IV pilus biogenesis protein CpaD/CtpE
MKLNIRITSLLFGMVFAVIGFAGCASDDVTTTTTETTETRVTNPAVTTTTETTSLRD